MSESFRPIFIVGASRSGTTMMNRILGRHPEVAALNELHYFGDLYNLENTTELWSRDGAVMRAARLIARINHGIWHDEPKSADKLDAAQIIDESRSDGWHPLEVYQRVLERQVEQSGSKFATDQTPRNIYYSGQLLDRYENAIIVHMIRDPRAVVYSQRRRWRKPWVGTRGMPVIEVIRSYCNFHPWTMAHLWKKAIRQDVQLQGHPRYVSIVFEELIAEPVRVIGELCQFIGVDFREDLLNVEQIGSSHQRDHHQQRGISPRTKDAWKTGLPKGDLLIVEYVAGSVLNRYGFRRFAINRNVLLALPAVLTFPLHILGVVLTNPARGWIQFKALINGSKYPL